MGMQQANCLFHMVSRLDDEFRFRKAMVSLKGSMDLAGLKGSVNQISWLQLVALDSLKRSQQVGT